LIQINERGNENLKNIFHHMLYC